MLLKVAFTYLYGRFSCILPLWSNTSLVQLSNVHVHSVWPGLCHADLFAWQAIGCQTITPHLSMQAELKRLHHRHSQADSSVNTVQFQGRCHPQRCSAIPLRAHQPVKICKIFIRPHVKQLTLRVSTP